MAKGHASYLGWLFKSTPQREKRTHQLTKLIRSHDLDFDAIAVTGVSGLVMGSIVASRLKKELIVVRKDGEDDHSGRLVEWSGNAERYIIIDDLIATGCTVKRIMEQIRYVEHAPECVGLFTYYDDSAKWDKWKKEIPTLAGLEWDEVVEPC